MENNTYKIWALVEPAVWWRRKPPVMVKQQEERRIARAEMLVSVILSMNTVLLRGI